MARTDLWTPEGLHSLKERDVIAINSLELSLLARLHEFAYKYRVSIVCQKCDQAITGRNADSDTHMAVSCGCREWRYTGGQLPSL